jgi:hypothetical protein
MIKFKMHVAVIGCGIVEIELQAHGFAGGRHQK